MIYATLLKEEQIFGYNLLISDENQTEDQDMKLELFKKRGNQARMTDFAILLGGFASNGYYLNNTEKLKDRIGRYYTQAMNEQFAVIVDLEGDCDFQFMESREIGCRPVLVCPNILDNFKKFIQADDGLYELNYGEYPQFAVSKEMQDLLEILYLDRELVPTGTLYTSDSRYPTDRYSDFASQSYIEYKYQGKKYIRVKVDVYDDSNPILNYFNIKESCQPILSNGEKYKNGDYVWIEVEPIKWIVDSKNNLLIADNILFAGVQFQGQYQRGFGFEEGNFKTYTISRFLNQIFMNDINTFISNNNNFDLESLSSSSIQKVFTLK